MATSQRPQSLHATRFQSPFARQPMLMSLPLQMLTVVAMSSSKSGISEASRTRMQAASGRLLALQVLWPALRTVGVTWARGYRGQRLSSQ